MTDTQPHEPNDSEFDAIVARDLSELSGLDSGPAAHPQPTPDLAGQAAVVQPQPRPPGPESTDLETELLRDGYRPPAGPDDTHELPVSFTLRHAIKAGFGMTVLAAAVGQTLFFASFFGGGLLGYGLAVLIAAFAEVTMIGSGDAALRHKVEGNQGWQLLLGVSALVAVGATVMQVAHWTAQNQPVMALTFGAASLLGWIVHISSGLITAAGYLARRAEWDAELDRRRRKRESRADAEHERRMAERESPQQASHRAVTEVEPAEKEPGKPAKSAKSSAGTGKDRSGQAPRPVKQQVVAWARENNAGYKRVARYFQELGYSLPPSTARDWLANG